MLSTYLVNFTYWETFQTVMSQNEVSTLCLLLISLNFMLSIFMGIILTLFCTFHLRLLVTNYTTLEYCEKKREKVSTWQVSPFNKGTAYKNIQAKLGQDPLLYMVSLCNCILCEIIKFNNF